MARGQYIETMEIAALRWLIAFTEGRTSPLALARAGKAYLQPAAWDAFKALTPAEVAEVKQAVHALLDTMARKTDPPPADEHRFTVTLTAASSGQGIVLFVDGAPRDVVLYHVSIVLDRIGTDRLHGCPAPDCRRLFLKLGRREYCSPTCQRRMYLASYNPFAAQARRPTTAKTRQKTTKGSRHGKTTRAR